MKIACTGLGIFAQWFSYCLMVFICTYISDDNIETFSIYKIIFQIRTKLIHFYFIDINLSDVIYYEFIIIIVYLKNFYQNI